MRMISHKRPSIYRSASIDRKLPHTLQKVVSVGNIVDNLPPFDTPSPAIPNLLEDVKKDMEGFRAKELIRILKRAMRVK